MQEGNWTAVVLLLQMDMTQPITDLMSLHLDRFNGNIDIILFIPLYF